MFENVPGFCPVKWRESLVGGKHGGPRKVSAFLERAAYGQSPFLDSESHPVRGRKLELLEPSVTS